MVGFPLLLIPLAIYNIVALLMPSVKFTDTLFKVPMLSAVEWQVTLSDILLALGIILLLLEVVKGARPGAKFVMDHLLSLVVFGAAAAEFVLWPKFSAGTAFDAEKFTNSTFFLLTLLAMADFFTGIAQRTRRRAVAVEAAPVTRRSKQQAEVASAEPQFEPPAPRPTVTPQPTVVTPPKDALPKDAPPEQPSAESAPKDRPELSLAKLAPTPDMWAEGTIGQSSNKETTRLQLQPNNPTPPSPDDPPLR